MVKRFLVEVILFSKRWRVIPHSLARVTSHQTVPDLFINMINMLINMSTLHRIDRRKLNY